MSGRSASCVVNEVSLTSPKRQRHCNIVRQCDHTTAAYVLKAMFTFEILADALMVLLHAPAPHAS
eukprot:4305668-Prymnesium_polylepis.1